MEPMIGLSDEEASVEAVRTNILADVDAGIKAKRVPKVPAFVRRKDREEEIKYGPDRLITLNNAPANANEDFSSNAVITSKYTVWSFLPLSLFTQFTRLANFFFLIVAILVWIPAISPVQPYGPVAALSFLVAVTLIREAIEDIRRHRDDTALNNSRATVLRNGALDEAVAWKDIRVGDILQVREDEYLPVDMLVINSSEPNGTCYVSTMQLDGETNAKAKQAPAVFHHVSDERVLAALEGTVRSEGVNKHLDSYRGTLFVGREKFALDNRGIMYRGSKLVNTKWVYGMAVFTGNQTKIMKNNIRGRFKQSSMEDTLNRIILAVFCVLGIIMMAGAIGMGANVALYRQWPFLLWTQPAAAAAIVNFFTFFILFSGLVPISLYVYLELVKTGHVFWIDWDIEMYYPAGDTRANAKSSLSDDLGMIGYVFSDKTGTLTRNEMVFKGASIDGVQYGDKPGHDTAFADMPLGVQLFFKLLALCHTVLVEQPSATNAHLRYNAESPDEAALVSAAAAYGFRLVSRETTTTGSFLTLEEGPRKTSHRYQLLNVLDFTSDRKRMSVVVRDCEGGRLFLLCKGADNIIKSLLHGGQEALTTVTDGHLDEYAGTGLRTLMLGMRELDATEYVEWNRKYVEASTSMEDRAAKIATVSLEMERDLQLLGASAIEDRLQDGVPEAIARLTAAGIKVWVLTGDRKDTAINIGFASQLLLPHYKLIVVDADEWHQTQLQLKDALETYIKPRPLGNGAPEYALVIEGKTLRHALEPENRMHLLAVATQCKAVICCRVGPKQKSEVVALVKNTLSQVVLSIGDGANDVPMIKEAHVGVGISGKEGRQAVMSADYAIGQFAYVADLLLVHGRWAYKRIVMVILWSFYKSAVFAGTNLWFAIFNAISGQTLYESWTLGMYHVLFTSLPILVYGIFDQDVSRRTSQSYPQLYEAGRLRRELNLGIFARWALMGIVDSLLCFFVAYLVWGEEIIDSTGTAFGLWAFGLQIYSGVVFVVLGRLALHVNRWTWLQGITFVISILVFYGFTFLLGETSLHSTDASMFGVAQSLFTTSSYWLTLFLTVTTALLSEFLWNIVRRFFFPEDVHVAQYIVYKEKQQQRRGLGKVKVLDMARAQAGLDPELPYSPFASLPEHGRSMLALAQGSRQPARFLVNPKARVDSSNKRKPSLVFDDDIDNNNALGDIEYGEEIPL